MGDFGVTAVGVVLDCADPERLADFWQAAIGFTRRTGDGQPYVTLSATEIRRPLNHLTLQRVPEPKVVKNRTHLDLFSTDVASEVARLVELGATITSTMAAVEGSEDLLMAELADPEGHEFCVIARPSKD